MIIIAWQRVEAFIDFPESSWAPLLYDPSPCISPINYQLWFAIDFIFHMEITQYMFDELMKGNYSLYVWWINEGKNELPVPITGSSF